MDTLILGPLEDTVKIQDEPALDIALPQVFTKPDLGVLVRGKLPNPERLVMRLCQPHGAQNGHTLGPDYQDLVNEFQPLFTWTMACWDYLLTTEGCRFLLRNSDDKLYCRGDYRAMTSTDFSRLVHKIFRQSIQTFAQQATDRSLAAFLRATFWDAIIDAYGKLENPPDPRQRKLTAYSYLRCVPYQFLNPYHHDLVMEALHKLPPEELRAIKLYFLQFLTIPATADEMVLSEDAVHTTLQRALVPLLINQRLVYCLLRQIERY